MEWILVGFCVILLGLYGSKAIMMHKEYNDQLYAHLFSSYLEYFFRNAIRHDCSTSNYVASKIGKHRLSFTTIQNKDGQVTSRFVLIFYNKGIACISYLNPKGELHGKMDDKHWMVQRDQKTYKINNPMLECKKYSERLRKLCPTFTVQEYICVHDECDTQKFRGNITHYHDILDTLKSMNLPYVSEDMIVQEYQKLSEKRGEENAL